MMPLLAGRIDRKTFIMACGVGMGVLLAVVIPIVLSVALIDLVVNGSRSSSLFKPVYYIFAAPPVAAYVLYITIMAIKRAHDVGLPGVPLLLLVGIIEIVSRLSGLWVLHLIVLLMVVLLGIIPSQKNTNKFGPRPHKRFRFANLRL